MNQEYEGREDRDRDGVAFEEPPQKRKKTTVLKRSQTIKTSSPNVAQLNVAEYGTANQGGHEHEQASQLSTPPDSGKRGKANKAAGPIASTTKAKQTPPFKNPIITKVSVTREKDAVREVHRLNSIISHKGSMPAEAKVKYTSVVLAKTTMEKLEAFRFKPAPDPHNITIAHHTSKNDIVDQEDDLIQRTFGEAPRPSQNYDVPSNSLFDEALRAVNTRTKFNGAYQTPSQPVATPNLAAGGNEFVQQPQFGLESDMLELERGPVMGRTHKNSILAKESPESLPYGGYEPTSCEMHIFDDLTTSAETELGTSAETVIHYIRPTSGQPDVSRRQQEGIEDAAMDDRTIAKRRSCLSDDRLHPNQLVQESGFEHHYPQNRSTRHLPPHQRRASQGHDIPPFAPNAPSTSQNNDNDDQPKRKIPFTAYHIPAQWNGEVQIERSNGKDNETLSKGLSKDIWNDDEFDQGLDDDDLLAIVSDGVVPPTAITVLLEQQKTPGAWGQFMLPSTPADPNSRIPNALTPRNPSIIDIINPNSSPTQQILPEHDDEYPMADEDEEELLKLSELGVTVKECLAPLESVQQALHILEGGEVLGISLQLSPLKSRATGTSQPEAFQSYRTDNSRVCQSPGLQKPSIPVGEEEDRSFIRSNEDIEDTTRTVTHPFCELQAPAAHSSGPHQASSTCTKRFVADYANVQTPSTLGTLGPTFDDSHDYEPMNPFARPEFPGLVLDRSPVVGFSAQTYLRTCFRIGEMFGEAVRCDSLAQDAVIELFARVTFSSRETGSAKQHFQFADLWHDRPPYPNGLLANYKTTGLAESESKVFLGENGRMARCLGRFKRDLKNSVWVLHIINIRETDWEEIRWTKEIVNHGQVKTEKGWVSTKL